MLCMPPRPQPPGTDIQRPPAGGTSVSNGMAPGRPARVSEPKGRIGKDKRSESREVRQGSPASGAAERFRDRRNAKGQLNELAFLKMAGAAGLEPATIGFGDRCSTNWNYAPATNEANYTKPGSKVKAFFLTFDAIEQFTSKSRQFPQPAGVTCCICSPAGVGMGHKWG